MRYCPQEKEMIEDCGECEMCEPEKSESEIWGEYQKESKERKEKNLKNSTEILKQEGISFVVLSEYHYRIGDFDFWPSTGKFHNRKLNKYGRGVFNLIKLLK